MQYQVIGALGGGRWREELEKKRLNALYSDAYQAFLLGGVASMTSLADLLRTLRVPQDEVSAEEDAQIRLAYGLVGSK